MAETLQIISSGFLTDITETEINGVIEEIVLTSRENMDEICELTLECTALLSSAENRSAALSQQGVFKRVIGNITGKNQKLQNAILQDNTNAMYAAQGIINRVMSECLNNRKLMVAVNNRMNGLFLELKEDQIDLAAGVLMVRKAIVAFYEKYREEMLIQDARVTELEAFQKTRCACCQKEIPLWKIICPFCGQIHPLKEKNLSAETKDKINKISAVIKDNSVPEDIVWNLTAQKKARVLRKVQTLAAIGELPGYTSELDNDVEALLNKCKSAEFQIAIVGVMKAGKSFLMNALMGAEIASVEVNPETAALTKFRSADHFYVNVKFHDQIEWNKLKDSVKLSSHSGQQSLKELLGTQAVIEMENQWIDHDDLYILCEGLEHLKEIVKKYTSSQTMEHLFVSEVEVGVDRKIFNMPHEVVFVDTPGLKDPVKYRSDITREYVKNADAVLIAVPTAALTSEGNEIITTVLDCVDAKKAYIVATQKDLKDNDEDCEKIISLWTRQLYAAKRYSSTREASRRIIPTSAKIDLLLNRWINLTESERDNPAIFSDEDFATLESFAKRVLNSRRYDINQLSYDEDSRTRIEVNAGITILRRKLDNTLIKKYREIKAQDILESFDLMKKEIRRLCASEVEQKRDEVRIANLGADAIKEEIEKLTSEKASLQEEIIKIRSVADKLNRAITLEIAELKNEGV